MKTRLELYKKINETKRMLAFGNGYSNKPLSGSMRAMLENKLRVFESELTALNT